MKSFILISSLIFSCHFKNPEEFFVVEYCNDGDTCTLKTVSGVSFVVRIIGIDAPEVEHKKSAGQYFGNDAKIFLNQKIQNKKVTLKYYGFDPYKRSLVEIFLGKENIGLKMICSGYAFIYKKINAKILDLNLYSTCESSAQRNKLGIWNEKNKLGKPIEMPWDFRKKYSSN